MHYAESIILGVLAAAIGLSVLYLAVLPFMSFYVALREDKELLNARFVLVLLARWIIPLAVCAFIGYCSVYFLAFGMGMIGSVL